MQFGICNEIFKDWKLEDAMETIQSLRPVVDFAPVYVKSVEDYVRQAASLPQSKR